MPFLYRSDTEDAQPIRYTSCIGRSSNDALPIFLKLESALSQAPADAMEALLGALVVVGLLPSQRAGFGFLFGARSGTQS